MAVGPYLKTGCSHLRIGLKPLMYCIGAMAEKIVDGITHQSGGHQKYSLIASSIYCEMSKWSSQGIFRKYEAADGIHLQFKMVSEYRHKSFGSAKLLKDRRLC